MSDEDKIDFSALDSSRANPKRWEQLIARTTARALATRRPTLFSELTRLAWPLVTAAAVVSVMAFFFLAQLPATGSSGATESISAESFSDWANQGEIPHTVDVYELTGERG